MVLEEVFQFRIYNYKDRFDTYSCKDTLSKCRQHIFTSETLSLDQKQPPLGIDKRAQLKETRY